MVDLLLLWDAKVAVLIAGKPGGSSGSSVVAFPGGSTHVVTVADANGLYCTWYGKCKCEPSWLVRQVPTDFCVAGGTVKPYCRWCIELYTGCRVDIQLKRLLLTCSSTAFTVIGTDGNGCTFSGYGRCKMLAIACSKHWSGCGYLVQVQSTTLNASGGVTYTWSPTNGADYRYHCNSSRFPNYTVVASDAVGCTASATVNVNVQSSPSKSAINFPLCRICCHWMPPGGTSHTSGCQMVKPHKSSTLPPPSGAYSVQVTDAYGCSTTASYQCQYRFIDHDQSWKCVLLPGDSAILDAGVVPVWIIVGQMARQRKPLLWILRNLVWLLLTLPVAVEQSL